MIDNINNKSKISNKYKEILDIFLVKLNNINIQHEQVLRINDTQIMNEQEKNCIHP
ncbi:MAG: hypothetical protein ACD_26C00023G0002 [uncultured bacterium]|nr:MAG: hypothetical protein ACD_26C00023G0002 [uncultured bacterium]